jgi:hypothetical protein
MVDNGASHHMTRSHKSLMSLTEKNSRLQVELGDNSKYAVKGVKTTLFQLKSIKPLKMSEVLYVPRLKKNLLSISTMENIGYEVEFFDGQVFS